MQLLYLACGALLLTAVLVLWRRELAVIIRVFAMQGAALAVLVGVLAAHENSAELWAVAAGVLVLRAGVLPYLLRRALAGAGESQRETRPLVNVSASLLAAAALTLWNCFMMSWTRSHRSAARRSTGVIMKLPEIFDIRTILLMDYSQQAAPCQ